jgi:hypothetical protein
VAAPALLCVGFDRRVDGCKELLEFAFFFDRAAVGKNGNDQAGIGKVKMGGAEPERFTW